MAAADTAARLGAGMANELILDTDYAIYLVSYVAPGYYAVLGVNAGSSLGRARFALRQMIGMMLDEL
jgi:hypothetical protein